jgi:hypothetical protein
MKKRMPYVEGDIIRVLDSHKNIVGKIGTITYCPSPCPPAVTVSINEKLYSIMTRDICYANDIDILKYKLTQ